MNKHGVIEGVKRKLGFGRIFDKSAKKAEQDEIEASTKEFLKKKKNKIKHVKSEGDES